MKPKKGKPKSLNHVIFNSIVSTLQANSSGEFDLPSFLIAYKDKSDPRYKLGLHRETYIPGRHAVPFFEPTDPKAMNLFRNQAGTIMQGLLGESYPIEKGKFSLPLCKECE